MGAQTGRPTVITPATVQKLEQAFRDGFTVAAACRTSGISTSTYYDHVAANETFSDTMALAQDYITHKAKQLVAQEISDGNLRAAQWWLERKAKAEFGVQAPINSELQPPNEVDCTDDLKQVLTELKRVGRAAEAQAHANRMAPAVPEPEYAGAYTGTGEPLL